MCSLRKPTVLQTFYLFFLITTPLSLRASGDNLVGVWVTELDGAQLEIQLAPDGTMSYSVKDQTVFGTYALGEEDILELWLVEEPGSAPDLVRLKYLVQDRSLTLIELRDGTDEPRPNTEATKLTKSDRKVLASIRAPHKTPNSAPEIEQTSPKEELRSGIQLSAGAKAAVSEFFLVKNRFPNSNNEAGLSEATSIASKYVTSVEVKNGLIIITYGNDADPTIHDRRLFLEPERKRGNGVNHVDWKCYSDTSISHYAPKECKEPWKITQSGRPVDDAGTASNAEYPKLLFSLPPIYPARAKSRGIEGLVRVQYSVGADGKPRDVIVMYSTSSIFDKAAVTSILERRYEPPGQVVTGLTGDIEFKLD